MLIIGIDQSTGSASAVGLTLLTKDMEILECVELRPHRKYLVVEKRLVNLHEQLTAIICKYMTFAIENKLKVAVVFEKTVMKGIAGESLAESVGAFVASFPDNDLITFHKVHNLQMKKFIGGTGKADKIGVAQGLLRRLDKTQHERVLNLINRQQWDALDSIALAVTYNLSLQSNIRI